MTADQINAAIRHTCDHHTGPPMKTHGAGWVQLAVGLPTSGLTTALYLGPGAGAARTLRNRRSPQWPALAQGTFHPPSNDRSPKHEDQSNREIPWRHPGRLFSARLRGSNTCDMTRRRLFVPAAGRTTAPAPWSGYLSRDDVYPSPTSWTRAEYRRIGCRGWGDVVCIGHQPARWTNVPDDKDDWQFARAPAFTWTPQTEPPYEKNFRMFSLCDEK